MATMLVNMELWGGSGINYEQMGCWLHRVKLVGF